MRRALRSQVRSALEGLEGRQLLSTAAGLTAPIPVAAQFAPAVRVANGESTLAVTPNNPSMVTLNAFSGTTPAVTSFNGKTVIAWVGTDPGHHINIATLNTGTSVASIPPNISVTTLAATSTNSPSLTVFFGSIELAWTGTDGHINLESSFDGVHFGGQVTLPDTSATSPAITGSTTLLKPRLYLAWTGTDGRINFEQTADGVHFMNKITFNQMSQKQVTVGNTTSVVNLPPALATLNGNIWLAYTGSDPQHHLNTMISTDGGLTFGAPTMLAATSLDGPALTAELSTSLQIPARMVIGWTGVGNQQLNVMSTTTNASGFSAPTTFTQTATNGLGLYSTVPGTLGIAWAGTDTQHHLNLLQM